MIASFHHWSIFIILFLFLFFSLISQHLWTRVFRKQYRYIKYTNKQNEQKKKKNVCTNNRYLLINIYICVICYGRKQHRKENKLITINNHHVLFCSLCKYSLKANILFATKFQNQCAKINKKLIENEPKMRKEKNKPDENSEILSKNSNSWINWTFIICNIIAK
jgi:hypothetical protein